MSRVTLLLFFLVLYAYVFTSKAQVKECEYKMVVHTGPTGGPSYKLLVILEAVGGDNINTTNVVKNWGAMGGKHTYFLPNSNDRFKTHGECFARNFCNIMIKGKKGELNPPWYINNITVATKGEGINRFSTFRFNGDHEIKYTNPAIFEGECP